MEIAHSVIASVNVDLLTESDLVAGFNLWMDEYMNDPRAFEETSVSAQRHLEERLDGKEYTYGDGVYSTLMAYTQKAKLNKGE